jgi:hypothetical protein
MQQQPYPHSQQPAFQPPPPKPSFWRRKVGCAPVWGWIIIAIIVMGLIGSQIPDKSPNTTDTDSTPTPAATTARTATTHPTSAPAAKVQPTKAEPKWVVIKTFSGHLSGGNWYYSPYFKVPDNWQVGWQSPNRDRSLPLVTIMAYDHSGNPIAGDDDIVARGSYSDIAGTGPVQKHGGTIRLQVYAQGIGR